MLHCLGRRRYDIRRGNEFGLFLRISIADKQVQEKKLTAKIYPNILIFLLLLDD
jgi:hypothetical protein